MTKESAWLSFDLARKKLMNGNSTPSRWMSTMIVITNMSAFLSVRLLLFCVPRRNWKRPSCRPDRQFDRRRRRPLARQFARHPPHLLSTGRPLLDADSRLQHALVSSRLVDYSKEISNWISFHCSCLQFRADSSLVDEATLGHKSLILDEDEPLLIPISEHDGLSEFGQVIYAKSVWF